jgi:hypothetical protein
MGMSPSIIVLFTLFVSFVLAAYDYQQRLAIGRQSAELLIADALRNLTRSTPGTAFLACDLANATICPPLEGGTAAVIVLYNSRGQSDSAFGVRLPVGLPDGVASYTVIDADAVTAVAAQLIPTTPADAQLREDYYNYAGSGDPVAWLTFQVRAKMKVSEEEKARSSAHLYIPHAGLLPTDGILDVFHCSLCNTRPACCGHPGRAAPVEAHSAGPRRLQWHHVTRLQCFNRSPFILD